MCTTILYFKEEFEGGGGDEITNNKLGVHSFDDSFDWIQFCLCESLQVQYLVQSVLNYSD